MDNPVSESLVESHLQWEEQKPTLMLNFFFFLSSKRHYKMSFYWEFIKFSERNRIEIYKVNKWKKKGKKTHAKTTLNG